MDFLKKLQKDNENLKVLEDNDLINDKELFKINDFEEKDSNQNNNSSNNNQSNDEFIDYNSNLNDNSFNGVNNTNNDANSVIADINNNLNNDLGVDENNLHNENKIEINELNNQNNQISQNNQMNHNTQMNHNDINANSENINSNDNVNNNDNNKNNVNINTTNDRIVNMLGSEFNPAFEPNTGQKSNSDIKLKNVNLKETPTANIQPNGINNTDLDELKSNLQKMHKFIMDFQKLKNVEIKTLYSKFEQVLVRLDVIEDKLKGVNNKQSVSNATNNSNVNAKPNDNSESKDSDPYVDLSSFFYAGK